MATKEDLERDRRVAKRAIVASQTTLDAKPTLTEAEYMLNKEFINEYLAVIVELNKNILDLCLTEPEKLTEIENQTRELIDVKTKLAESRMKVSINNETVNVALPVASATTQLKPPTLTIATFSSNAGNKFAFRNFLSQFEEAMAASGVVSNKMKLTFLKNYVGGEALNAIKHLSLSDDNYEEALAILKSEFLNLELIKDDTFRRFLRNSPSDMSNYNSVKRYLNSIRSLIQEMKEFGVDMVDPAGNSLETGLLAHIIRQNLPADFRKDLNAKAKTVYPKVSDILEHYLDILNNLSACAMDLSNSKTEPSLVKPRTKNLGKFNTEPKALPQKVAQIPKVDEASAPKGEATRKPPKTACRLCQTNGHYDWQCRQYISRDSRLNRANHLQICNACLSNKHLSDSCPGLNNSLRFACFICKGKSHISAVCPQAKYDSNAAISGSCRSNN